MYPPTRKSFFSKDNSIFRTVQLFSAATFAAFLLVTLNQSVTVDRRRQTDAELVLLKSLVPVPRVAKASPVVEISNGKVQGTVLTARNGREYSAFFQIPYAEPPLGKLRFQVRTLQIMPEKYLGYIEGKFVYSHQDHLLKNGPE